MSISTDGRVKDAETWLSLSDLFLVIWRGRWWVCASVVTFSIIFAVIANTAIPVYRASTVLISASADRNSLGSSLSSVLNQLGGIASIAGVSGMEDPSTAEAVAILKSRQFTERFFDDHQILPKLFPQKWDAVSNTWKVPPSEQPTFAQGFRVFDRNIRLISQDRKTSLWELRIDWRVPAEAAVWANDLVTRVNAEMRRRAIEKAAVSVRFLEDELKQTQQVETREAVNRLIEAQMKQRMLAAVTQEYAFRIVEKAPVPDAKEPVRPNKFLLYIAGPLVGCAIGLVLVVVLNALSFLIRKVHGQAGR